MGTTTLRRLDELAPGAKTGVAAGQATGNRTVERLKFAMSVLQYNQGFVNFTDGKANSLLLVNSIFLATGAAGDLSRLLPLAAVVVAAAAVLMCLSVVCARMPGQSERSRAKLVFFGHIAQRRNAGAYAEDLLAAGDREILESLSRQIHDLASVVDRKFKAYRLAQMVTLCSAGLWIGNLVVPALHALRL